MAGKKRMDPESEAAFAVIAREDRDKALLDRQRQAAREQLLAQYHQAIGQIKTANMFAEFSQVSALIWIHQMRETKAYKDFGTWEDFCKSIGYTRQHIEDQLKNLATFGEQFTQTVCALGVGYRDLRKLRQLTHDGTLTIDAEAVVIGEERIPLDADHKEDLQVAIEQLLDEAQKDVKAAKRVQELKQKKINEQEREIAELKVKLENRAQERGLSLEEDGIVDQIEKLRVELRGYFSALDNVCDAFLETSFPNAYVALISLTDSIKMKVSSLSRRVAENAPAGIIEDDWMPPGVKFD